MNETQTTTLGNLIRECGGSLKTGPFGTVLKASEYSKLGGVPLVSVGEVGHVTLRVSGSTPRIGPEVVRRLPEYVLRAGDIVFGRKGAVDRCAMIQSDEDGYFLGSDGIRLRLGAGVDARFMTCQLQSSRVRSWLLQNASGTTMASLNQEILGRVPVRVPPLAEQRYVGETLADADDLIASLELLIAKKQAIKQGMMQQLLTGGTRLPGFVDEWESVTLGNIARFSKGAGLPKSDLIPNGSTPCIHYGELFTFYGPEIRQVASRTNLPKPAVVSEDLDVLMPTSDVTPRGLAKASAVHGKGVALGGDILVIRPEKLRAYGPFLAHVIRQDANQVLQLVRGSTVYHLYASDMRNFAISIPALEEQRAIAGVLLDADQEIAGVETRLAKARDIKTGMMQQLLTGRTRLSVEEVTA